MKSPLLVILFCLLPFLASPAFGQGPVGKVTAVFIYQFTKHIQWPAAASQGNFTIGVVGNTPVYEELQKMAQRLKVGGQRTILVKKVEATDVAVAQNCQILFLAKGSLSQVKALEKELHSLPVLLITEGYGMAQKGSVISIYIDEEEENVKFELSKKHLNQHQLQVTTELLKLAANVW